ncbi:MAG: hypothetical protein ACP5OG_04225 [Candidatus Nanoarchaeia archaeon]
MSLEQDLKTQQEPKDTLADKLQENYFKERNQELLKEFIGSKKHLSNVVDKDYFKNLSTNSDAKNNYLEEDAQTSQRSASYFGACTFLTGLSIFYISKPEDIFGNVISASLMFFGGIGAYLELFSKDKK